MKTASVTRFGASLAHNMIQRCHRGMNPPARITTPDPDHTLDLRGLNEVRDLYIEQSRNTVAGRVAPLPDKAV